MQSNGAVELEPTDRELGFDGVPAKSMVFIQPTTHALVHLTELPFLVVSLDDVELVSLERVQVSERSGPRFRALPSCSRSPSFFRRSARQPQL